MQHWGLNTYLYGPKDDLKHRLLWREVYSPEEEGQLRTLIVEAKSRGLKFVYALSPGQDIVFSSSCDLTLLKRKLRQVSDLGCQAFAILFDDIDHSMCQADSEAFSSFAHAQVTVTNEIYRFLGEPPVFLFCPTEYCGSLCSPSVSKSPYLQTVGEDLLPDITVVWTDEECEYCPDRALSAALRDWMEELNQPLQAGRQSTRADQRSSATASRCKTPDRSDCPSTLRGTSTVAKLPVFPLNSSSPPSSPTKVNGDREAQDGEKKRSNQSSQPNHQPPGSRPGAPPGGGRGQKAQSRGVCGGKGLLSESQVRLLVGLHYLPHEHGPSAQKLLQDLTWLKTNCHLVGTNSKKAPPQKIDEWRGRASRFLSLCEDIAQLHCSVVGGANRAVLYDLYPYVWDLRNMALVAKAFICWLELYRMVRQLHLRTQGGQESSIAHPDIIGDRCLGPCLALCPEYSFILEDELGVCGCVLGILDVRSFAKRCQASWMPAMRDKYPHKGGNTHPNTQDLIQLMEEDQGEYPDSLLYHFPSQLRLDALPELVDISVSRTLLTALLTALKANASYLDTRVVLILSPDGKKANNSFKLT
ncbi:Protein O-GlcNAcase [Nibea albiflora]|uniref:Protein O-GlcNAcase n=1 Tax=Nibea albiflora TaxID=240163 RepID=A0ACB7EWM7_NIBAL|nr:Protein O-GlcNAcase [Nibea albiflora]